MGRISTAVAAVCKEATEPGLDSKCSDKLCHMPDLVMKCNIFLQTELKDKEGGFHIGRCSCEKTGMRGQKVVGWRKIDNTRGFRKRGELLQPEAQHKRALQVLPKALPRMVLQPTPCKDEVQTSQPSALMSPTDPQTSCSTS